MVLEPDHWWLQEEFRRMRKVNKEATIAIDPSPNGTAALHFIGKRLVDYRFTTQVKKRAKKHGEHAILIPDVKQGDENARMERLAIVRDAIIDFVQTRRGVYCVGIEDYVWNVHGQAGGIIQLTELGGILRLNLWERGYRIRTYEPMSVKIGWTGSGSADKKEMMELARIRLKGTDLEESLTSLPVKEFENVADAIAIGDLLRWELRFRQGKVTLDRMPERVVRIMNRITKAVPVCLIDRPFMERT